MSAASAILSGVHDPTSFRAALLRVPRHERDAWWDAYCGIDALPDDGPELPRGGVPYMPCAVDVLLRAAELADITAADVFVDVGAGIGRAMALIHLLTGASTVGIEIQPALVDAARARIAQLALARCTVIEGDAALLTAEVLARGSVFFLYCPFGGARLDALLATLETIARTREIRLCCVDLPLPPLPWLTLASPTVADLAVYRSRRS